MFEEVRPTSNEDEGFFKIQGFNQCKPLRKESDLIAYSFEDLRLEENFMQTMDEDLLKVLQQAYNHVPWMENMSSQKISLNIEHLKERLIHSGD